MLVNQKDPKDLVVLDRVRLERLTFLPYVYDGLERIALLKDPRLEGVVLVAGTYAGKSPEGNLYKRLTEAQMALADKEIRAREKAVKEIRYLQLEAQG